MSTNTLTTHHPQNPISCEPCRQKKRKCDRLLPICTQCATTPSTQSKCIYPESGKRGLPQGYITHLEHRLAATEAALFTVYAQLRAGNYTQLPIQSPTYETAAAVSVDVVASSSGSRVESMAEWDALPLRGPAELERWWGAKRGVWGNDIENDSGNPGGFEREGGDGRDMLVENGTGDARTDANLDIDSGKMSRAERLARLESKVYF